MPQRLGWTGLSAKFSPYHSTQVHFLSHTTLPNLVAVILCVVFLIQSQRASAIHTNLVWESTGQGVMQTPSCSCFLVARARTVSAACPVAFLPTERTEQYTFLPFFSLSKCLCMLDIEGRTETGQTKPLSPWSRWEEDEKGNLNTSNLLTLTTCACVTDSSLICVLLIYWGQKSLKTTLLEVGQVTRSPGWHWFLPPHTHLLIGVPQVSATFIHLLL